MATAYQHWAREFQEAREKGDRSRKQIVKNQEKLLNAINPERIEELKQQIKKDQKQLAAMEERQAYYLGKLSKQKVGA